MRNRVGQTIHVIRGNQTIVVSIACSVCNVPQHIPNVDKAGLMRWGMGQAIQTALPELSSDQREMFLSGTCPSCWDMYYKQSQRG
jgi:hypothetical protein